MFINREQTMEMNDLTRAILLDAAVQALRRHGIAADVRRDSKAKGHLRVDALLRVGKDQKRIDYVVEVKRNPTAATVGALVTQLRHAGKAARRPALLVTDYLTPPLANQLRAQKLRPMHCLGVRSLLRAFDFAG